jgi:hypothetical protein
MGILVLVLGLLSAGIVVDFLVENGLGGGPDMTFQLFGGSFHMTVPELVLGAAALGAIAISFVALGMALMGVSWGKRKGRAAEMREMRGRLDESERRRRQLEKENGELAKRKPAVVDLRSTDERAATAPPPPPPPPSRETATTSS